MTSVPTVRFRPSSPAVPTRPGGRVDVEISGLEGEARAQRKALAAVALEGQSFGYTWEDYDLVGNVQAGLETRGFELGPLSHREAAIAWFADRIRADLE